MILKGFRFLYENAFIICIAHGIGVFNYLLLMYLHFHPSPYYWKIVLDAGYIQYLMPIWGVLCIMALMRESFHSDKDLKAGRKES